MKRWLTGAVLSLFVVTSAAEASTITINDTFQWGVAPATYQVFTDSTLPLWTHTLTFATTPDSITSATITLRHAGNKASNRNGSNGEFWLLSSQGSVLLGNLSASWSQAAGDFFVTDVFAIPFSLLPALPAAGWSLALRLNETTNQVDSIALDYSTLSMTYETAATSTPEPATLSLVGVGIAAAAWRHRRRSSQSAA